MTPRTPRPRRPTARGHPRPRPCSATPAGHPARDHPAPATPAPATPATTTDTTGGDTTTGGELPDCDPYPDEASCEAAEGRTWFFETSACIIDCSLLTDEATCNEAMICFWGGDTCFPPI